MICVPESRFGVWFLGTNIWKTHVIDFAINDLNKLIKDRKQAYPVILDVGCGSGLSLARLGKCFSPNLTIGMDINVGMMRRSVIEAKDKSGKVTLVQGNCADLPFSNESIDLLFCHQSFHHLVDQEGAIAEFHRVLKPHGLLLFAESTRVFIHSWIIRLLFRHPMEVQKTASEYHDLIKAAGFSVEQGSISYPYLWWSRSDFGLGEKFFHMPPSTEREETLINLVAVRT